MADEPSFTRVQLRFIEAYIADPMRDPGNAAVKSGVAADMGAAMIAMEHVRDEIKFRLERVKDRSGRAASIDKAKLEDMVLTIIERCMRRVAIVNRHGVRTGEYKFNANSALKGIEVFAKLRGYTDRNTDSDKPPQVLVTVEDLIPVIMEANRRIADGNMLIIQQPQQEIADGPEASPVDRTLPGEDTADVPASITMSAKNIDEFLTNLKKMEIVDGA